MEVLVSGSLDSPRRTVMGVVGQLALFGLSEAESVEILELAGLPSRALGEPDFPISVGQELAVLAMMLERLKDEPDRPDQLIAIAYQVNLSTFGVLGLAMQHAATVGEALRVLLTFPELCWGHSRIALRRGEVDGQPHAYVTFSMDPPESKPLGLETLAVDGARLRTYCLIWDMVSVLRMVEEGTGETVRPSLVSFPFPAPKQAEAIENVLRCPVVFGASRAEILYPPRLPEMPMTRANLLAFRANEKIARELSRMLAADVGAGELATRLLWAYSPIPTRKDLARMMGLSERTLARRLKEENTSYNGLVEKVQTERAANLLQSGSLSVSEVALRMGYSDPAAFSRAFHRWTGVAPSRFERTGR